MTEEFLADLDAVMDEAVRQREEKLREQQQAQLDLYLKFAAEYEKNARLCREAADSWAEKYGL